VSSTHADLGEVSYKSRRSLLGTSRHARSRCRRPVAINAETLLIT
jgi:hypothetical protein